MPPCAGSGALGREELASVVKSFYKAERVIVTAHRRIVIVAVDQVSRGLEVVYKEVDDAISRFDASGDGQLQAGPTVITDGTLSVWCVCTV